MMPGPIIIRECTHCKGQFKESTIASGNTFGARYWTDGKMEADMMPEVDWLVSCPNCLAPVWVDSAEEVGRVHRPYRESPEDYKNADQLEYGRSPSAEEYLKALEDLAISTEEQVYIRFRLWWLWNDARRKSKKPKPFKNYEVTNLEALIKLQDESDINELVTKAEMNRELGRFEEAIRLLDWPDKSDDGSRIEKWSGLFEQIFLIYKWKTCGVTLPREPLAAVR